MVSMCILYQTVVLVSSEALAASKWPLSLHLNSDLKSATLITLVTMCIFTATAILVAPEAVAASRWPHIGHI